MKVNRNLWYPTSTVDLPTIITRPSNNSTVSRSDNNITFDYTIALGVAPGKMCLSRGTINLLFRSYIISSDHSTVDLIYLLFSINHHNLTRYREINMYNIYNIQ